MVVINLGLCIHSVFVFCKIAFCISKTDNQAKNTKLSAEKHADTLSSAILRKSCLCCQLWRRIPNYTPASVNSCLCPSGTENTLPACDQGPIPMPPTWTQDSEEKEAQVHSKVIIPYFEGYGYARQHGQFTIGFLIGSRHNVVGRIGVVN